MMGYGVYEWRGRWQGYGVPAVCDHPVCGAEIDRGMAYMCGEEPSAEKGCGRFFCASHLLIAGGVEGEPQLCDRCVKGEPPFKATPDTGEWIQHMLTDPSWAPWRDENPERVAAMTRGS